jgi:hypothetical protein
MFARGERLVV